MTPTQFEKETQSLTNTLKSICLVGWEAMGVSDGDESRGFKCL